MTPEIVRKKVLAEGRFLRLCENEFRDEQNRTRYWESVERTNSTGAVIIAAMLKESRRVLLVRQFRPPTGKFSIELPAGLLDKPGESVADAAVRELYEETGYTGKVLRILDPAYSSPGMSRESIIIAIIEIDDSRYPVPPEPHNEDGECIETFAVKLEELETFLNNARSNGDAVEARAALSPYIMPAFFGK